MLTGKSPGHKGTGNFQKVLVLIFFFSLNGEHGIRFSHYGCCISSLCDKDSQHNNLVGFAGLKAIIYYIYYSSKGLCEKLLPICTFFIVSFVTVVYVFVFQNIIIEERNLYVFKIIRANWSFCFFLPLNFRVLSPELFNPYCQLANCSQNSILSLPIDGINYFLMELKFLFSETSSSTAVFFLTMM